MAKQTVIFDFDGVIHSYSSGWQGTTVIPDPPVLGIREAIAEIRQHYRVVVVSSRCYQDGGIEAIKDYLAKYDIEVDDVTDEKPAAIVTVDDRGITFDGHPELLLEKIKAFVPWNRSKKPQIQDEDEKTTSIVAELNKDSSSYSVITQLKDAATLGTFFNCKQLHIPDDAVLGDRKMNIPDKIKLGGQHYDVIFDLYLAGQRDNFGETRPLQNAIAIAKEAAKEQQEETLLHEILEIIKYNNDLALSHQDLSTIATSLYQVLKDNKLSFSD